LNRTRLYVPARTLWGALTAELSRAEAANSVPEYETVGDNLKDRYRFTYLFPAEMISGKWVAWLPIYCDGEGLRWKREDGAVVTDRALRRRLLSTRPGTAIDTNTDTAEEGSLRETECIEMHWRPEKDGDAGPVAMVGYVFMKVAKAKDRYPPERRRIDKVDTLFVGGDTRSRYGLGRLRRIEFVRSDNVFGTSMEINAVDLLRIKSDFVFAHARFENGEPAMVGALELLGGWDRGSLRGLVQAWQPGSRSSNGAMKWTIEGNGTWKADSPPDSVAPPAAS